MTSIEAASQHLEGKALSAEQKEELAQFLKKLLSEGHDEDCSICLDPMVAKTLGKGNFKVELFQGTFSVRK